MKNILTEVDFNLNEIQNPLAHKLAVDPVTPVEAQFWWNTVSKTIKYYNGTAIKTLSDTSNPFPVVNNNRILITSGGAVAEHIAMTPTRICYFDANGLPNGNAAFTYNDATAAMTLAGIPGLGHGTLNMSGQGVGGTPLISMFGGTGGSSIINMSTGGGSLTTGSIQIIRNTALPGSPYRNGAFCLIRSTTAPGRLLLWQQDPARDITFIVGASDDSTVMAPELFIQDDRVSMGVVSPLTSSLSSILTLGGSTTSRSSLQIYGGIYPSVPVVGDIVNDSSQMSFRHRQLIGNISTIGFLSANTGDSNTIAATATETDFTTNNSNFPIPANSLATNKKIEIEFWGRYGTGSSQTIALKLKIGAVVLLTTPTMSMANGLTNQGWYGKAMITIKSIGVGGTLTANLMASFNDGASAERATTLPNITDKAIDTTIANTLQISGKWGSSNASNTITVETITFKVIN